MDLYIVNKLLRYFVIHGLQIRRQLQHPLDYNTIISREKLIEDILPPTGNDIIPHNFDYYRDTFVARCEYWIDILLRAECLIEVARDKYIMGNFPPMDYPTNDIFYVEKTIERIYQRLDLLQRTGAAAAPAARTAEAMTSMKNAAAEAAAENN